MNLVHIGLPRTGNTTLQNALFARQDRFFYVGKRNDAYPSEAGRELVIRIACEDSLEYSQTRTESLLRSVCEGSGSKPLLLADEFLSLAGRADRRLIAERLHRLFAPAKALIILRAQTTMVQAFYLKHLGFLDDSVISFEAWLDREYDGMSAQSLINRITLNYDPLVRIYEEVFGPENVVVLPSELMHVCNSIYAQRMAELFGMPPDAVEAIFGGNKGEQRVSRRYVAVHRFQNLIQHLLPANTNLALLGRRLLPQALYRKVRGMVTGGARVEVPVLPDHWRRRIGEICAEGNARIESRRQIPLSTLGYPVPDGAA